MADFGWAFVQGGLVTGSAPPAGAVQFNDGSNKFGGSADLVFTSGSTSTLEMTGNILVDGDVSASVYYGDGSNLTGITTSPAGEDLYVQYNVNNQFTGSDHFLFNYMDPNPLGGGEVYVDSRFSINSSTLYVSGAITSSAWLGSSELYLRDFYWFNNILEITGTVNLSGTLNVNEINVNVENRNVINISATGSTQFGDSTDDTHIFTGSMEISAASNPLKLFGVQAGTPPNQSQYLALDSNYNLVLTSAAGAGIASYSRTSITSTGTASINYSIIGVNNTTAIEIRLPSAADYADGQYFTIKDEAGTADSNTITIIPSGSQLIDGRTSIILESPYAAVNLYSNGSDKFFIY